MKWKRLETRREKCERTQRDVECRAAEEQRVRQEQERLAAESTAFWSAYKHSKESEAAYQAWEAVFNTAYAGAAEDRAFWWTLQRLLDSKAADLEPLVEHLERDPWAFRSGYAKADAIRFLKRADLPDDTKDRLRRVVLHAVDSRDRREFRHFCRLARAVDSPELCAALHERLAQPNPDVRRRAGWALHACEQKR